MLLKINRKLVKRIFDGYLADNWWAKIRSQLLSNKNLSPDKAILFFVFGLSK